MRLIGLDFETANMRNGSICAAGLALLDDGVLQDSRQWLVRPHRSLDWMLPRFTQIHGISYQQLRHAPEFCDIWPDMAAFIASGDIVVIHNAPFDLGHLRAALTLYGLSNPGFPYVCSLAISRKLYPWMPSHTLNNVAATFGFFFCHHDALADATACATIVANTGIPPRSRKFFA